MADQRPLMVVMEYCRECGGFAEVLPRLNGYLWHWSRKDPGLCYPPPCYGDVEQVVYEFEHVEAVVCVSGSEKGYLDA